MKFIFRHGNFRTFRQHSVFTLFWHAEFLRGVARFPMASFFDVCGVFGSNGAPQGEMLESAAPLPTPIPYFWDGRGEPRTLFLGRAGGAPYLISGTGGGEPRTLFGIKGGGGGFATSSRPAPSPPLTLSSSYPTLTLHVTYSVPQRYVHTLWHLKNWFSSGFPKF